MKKGERYASTPKCRLQREVHRKLNLVIPYAVRHTKSKTAMMMSPIFQRRRQLNDLKYASGFLKPEHVLKPT